MMNRQDKNILVQSGKSKSMFESGFTERTDLEQYFWTEDTVQRLVTSISSIITTNEDDILENICCLTTPSLGH